MMEKFQNVNLTEIHEKIREVNWTLTTGGSLLAEEILQLVDPTLAYPLSDFDGHDRSSIALHLIGKNADQIIRALYPPEIVTAYYSALVEASNSTSNPISYLQLGIIVKDLINYKP